VISLVGGIVLLLLYPTSALPLAVRQKQYSPASLSVAAAAGPQITTVATHHARTLGLIAMTYGDY